MALQVVLESFKAHVAGDDWKFRAGELVEDGVAPVSGQAIVPIVALRAAGMVYIPYVVGTMAVMLGRYLAYTGQMDNPPSVIAWLLTYAIALTALTPLTGVANPNGVVTGLFGQQYRDTVGVQWYICTSNPTGTVWAAV